jgi:hypothetical protein
MRIRGSSIVFGELGKMIFWLLASLNILALSQEQATAATVYVSDCASGGHGTLADPYCLAETPGGVRSSAARLFDGSPSTPDVASGTTVAFICSSGTDCTYHVDCTTVAHGKSTWLVPSAVDNIVLTRAASSYRVTISGDADSNGTAANAEGFTTCVPGQDVGIAIWNGNAGRTGWRVQSLDFTNWLAIAFGDDNTAFPGWQFSDVNLSYIGGLAWGVTTGVDAVAGCDFRDLDGEPYAVYMWGGKGATLWNGGSIKHVCGYGFRLICGACPNPPTASTMTIQNTTLEDISQVMNNWGDYSWAAQAGRITTFQNNVVDSFGAGVAWENQNRGMIIKGNTFKCSTQYNEGVSTFAHECTSPISINQGDYTTKRNGANADFQITQNIIYGSRNTGDSDTANGWMRDGIIVLDSCKKSAQCTGNGTPWCCCTGVGMGRCNTTGSGGTCDDPLTVTPDQNYGCNADVFYTNLIENNMIYGITHTTVDTDPSYGINIDSNNAASIRFNTIYKVKDSGINIKRAVTTSNFRTNDAVPHGSDSTEWAVEGNIVDASGGTEMVLSGTNPHVNLRDNNLYDASGNIFDDGTTFAACSGLASLNTKWSPTCLGSGDFCNVCGAPSFTTTSGQPPTWDVHLLGAADASDFNAMSYGPPTDIDGDSRPQPIIPGFPTYDRGADEARISLTTGLQIAYSSWTTSVGGADGFCSVGAGETATLTLVVGNVSPTSDQTNVKLKVFTAAYPGRHLTYSSDTCGGGFSTDGTGHLVANIGSIAINSTYTCTVTFTCGGSGPGTLTRTIPFWWFTSDQISWPMAPEDPMPDSSVNPVPIFPSAILAIGA